MSATAAVEVVDWDGAGWEARARVLARHAQASPRVVELDPVIKRRGGPAPRCRVEFDGNVWRDAHAHGDFCNAGYVVTVTA